MSKETDLAIKTDFNSFARKCYNELHGEHLGNEPYIDYLFYHCNHVIATEPDMTVVNLPPRHLKTFIFSVCLPAWILALNPQATFMIVAANEDLAETITRICRKILRSKFYRRNFKTRLSHDNASAGNFETTAGGYVKATSLRGGLAGKGANYIILDDPHALEQARKPKKLAETIRLYDTDLMSRFNKAQRMILVMHRIHENDLTDHVLAQGGCNHIVLPFQTVRARTYRFAGQIWKRRKGELLRPGYKTKNEIKRLREIPARPEFRYFYQQGLERQSSAMLDLRHFPIIHRRDLPTNLPCIISVDPALKPGVNSSLSVIQVLATSGERHFFMEQFAASCDYRTLRREFNRLVSRYRPDVVLIEENSLGIALIHDDSRPKNYELVKIRPRVGKAERLAKHIPAIRRERVALVAEAEGLDLFMQQINGWPDAGDDCIDPFTQALDHLESHPTFRPREPRAAMVTVYASGQVVTPRLDQNRHQQAKEQAGGSRDVRVAGVALRSQEVRSPFRNVSNDGRSGYSEVIEFGNIKARRYR